MASILFYIFILLSSTFFVYISDKGKGLLEKRVFLSIAFLLVFIPSAIRYDVGTDFPNYVDIYNSLDVYSETLEPAFVSLLYLLKALNLNSQWLFISSAFIFTLALFGSYPKKNAWIIHFAAIGMLWFASFNIIRQSLAIAFTLLAVSYFMDKKYYKFFIICFIGVLFHFSAVFIILLGVLALIPVRRSLKSRTIPIIFISLIAITYISMQLIINYIQLILEFMRLDFYLGYFESEHFIQKDFGSGLGALTKVLFSTYIIFNAKSILEYNEAYWIIIPLNFLYAVSTILANDVIIFGRMQEIFILSPVISLYILNQIPIKRQQHKIVFILFATYIFLNFCKESIGAKTSYADPKLNPYKTILTTNKI